jgi:hypothetical protein
MNPLEFKHRPGVLEAIRHTIAEVISQAADSLKDSLIDLSLGDERAPAGPDVQDLPPLSTEEFIAAMRDKVEAALADVAAVLNEAPAGHVVEASEDRVQGVLFDLWCEALETGLQMRVDAAWGRVPPPDRGQGKWAEKFRRMRTGEPVFPYPKDAITGKRQWLKDLPSAAE